MKPSELIARYIRGEIAQAGVTQVQLAEALGLANQQAVSRRLKGETPFSIDELVAVFQLLDIESAEVLDEIQRLATREARRDHEHEKKIGVVVGDDDEAVTVEKSVRQESAASPPRPKALKQSKPRPRH